MATAPSTPRVTAPRALLASLASLATALLLVAAIAPAASAAPGDATLTVRVVSVSGAAQSGATLTAVGVADGLSVSSVVGTETPAKSGTYVFASLDSEVDYTIRVDTANSSTYYGGATQLDQARVVDVATGANTLSFALRGGALSGKVLTSKSKALKNVDVDLFGWNGTEWNLIKTVVSSTKGAYSFGNLEPGSYTTRFDATRLQPTYVSVFAGGKLATGTDAVPESITAAKASFVNYGATTSVSQKLVTGGKITGTVRGGATALAAVNVRAVALTGSPTAGWTSAAPLSTAVTTSSAGKFTLTGLATGYYALSYSAIPSNFSNSFTGLDAPTVIKVTAGKTTAATAAQTTLPAAELLVSGFPNNQVGQVEGTLTLRNLDGSIADQSALSTDGAAVGHVARGTYTWQIRATIAGVDAMPQNGEISVGTGVNNFLFDLVDDVAIDFMSAPVVAETATAVGTAYTVSATSNHPTTTRLDYQWLRDGLPIFGARAATYTAGGGDLGTQLAVRVTIVDVENGLDVAATVPAGSGVITLGAAPVQSTSVSITPGTDFYVGSVLRADPGEWNTPGLRFGYQWFDGATAIVGQTKSTYTVTGTEVEGIRVEVTAYKPGYPTVGPVSSSAVFSSPKPATLSASPKVTAKSLSGGRTQYTVSGGTWSTKPSVFEYQWRLDGQDVSGANSSKYISTDATRNNATIFVTVYPSKNNYTYGPVELVASKGTSAPYVIFTAGSVTISETSEAVIDDTLLPVGTTLDVEAGAYGHPGTDVAPTLSYQWLRGAGSTFTAITGATGTSYTVAAADVARELRVRVTGTAPAYPVPTQVVAAGVGELSDEIADESATVTITGDQVVGGTIAAKRTSDWVATGVTDTFQWYSCGGFECADQSAFAPISGATVATYVIPASLEGRYLSVRLIGTKAGSVDSQQSFSSAVRAWQAKTIVPLSDPAIASGLVDGDAMVGELLTAQPGTYNVSGVALSYEWRNCPSNSQCSIDQNWWADDTALARTYTPSGQAYFLGSGQLQLWEIATKKGYETRVTKTPIVDIVAGHEFEVVAPTFTVSGDTYTLAKGYWEGADPVFQWKLDGVNVFGATGSSYTRAPAMAAKKLELFVSVSNGPDHNGNPYGVTDFSKNYLVAKGASVAPAPAAITGNRVGDTLIAPNQPFTTPVDPGATTETFQWLSAGKAIAGATGSTWVATSSYLGKKITVRRTFSSENFASSTVTSLATTLALGGDSGGVPVVTPDANVKPGTTLTVTPTGYSSAYSFSYTWQYSADGTKFATIAKATAKTYRALASQVGGELRATVTIKRASYATVVKSSASLTVGATGVLAPTVAPTLTGMDAQASTVPAGTKLSVAAPTFATKATVSYRWLRNGVVVPGVTTASFTVPGSHYRDELSVEVTAKSAGFDNYVVTLGPVTVVKGAAPTATKVPAVTGTIASCTTLSASTGAWSVDGATYSYQWFGSVNGLRAGATEPTYTDVVGGEKLYVVVTADAEGFALGTARSKDSAVIPACAP